MHSFSVMHELNESPPFFFIFFFFFENNGVNILAKFWRIIHGNQKEERSIQPAEFSSVYQNNKL